MKSIRIIYVLFFLVSFSCFARFDSKDTFDNEVNQLTDSISFYHNQLNDNDAKAIIAAYKSRIDNGLTLTNTHLKRLAISFAQLKNPSKSSKYLKEYIISSYDINILHDHAFNNIKDSKEFRVIVDKYMPHLNGWIIFFFATGLIGVFLTIVINLRRKGDGLANILISSFVVMHSFFMIHLSLYLSRYIFNFPNALFITTSFSFLYGPLLYFYFKRISSRYEFKMRDILHLVPTIVLFLFLVPFYLLPVDKKMFIMYHKETVYSITMVIVILKSLSLAVYGFAVYKIYRKNLKKKNKHHEDILKWERNITILNGIYVISYGVYGVALMSSILSSIALILFYPQILSMSIIVLYVGYVAYVQPKVFSKKYLFNELSFLKYQKSGLTESYSLELKEILIKMLNDEKIYKINDINLDTLSHRLGTTRHSVSQVINEHFGVNFFNLLNKYRVYEAQEIFKSDYFENLNIIDVAYEVGFNNKVTFNKAFKDETKLTPTQYLKELKRGSDFVTSA